MSGGLKMALPQFTFKKYLGSIMVDADDDPSNILVTLRSFIEGVLEKIEDSDTVVLFIITEFDENNNTYESRIWFNKQRGTICFVSTAESKGSNRVYKIVVEAFSVPRIAAQLDLEVLNQYGFEVLREEGDINNLLKIIRNIIKLNEINKTTNKEKGYEPKGILGAPLETQNVKSNLAYCIRLVADSCVRGSCVRQRGASLIELLEDVGLLVLGEGSKYVCITRSEGKCLYRTYWIDGESLISECVNDFSKIKKIIEKYGAIRENIAIPIFR